MKVQLSNPKPAHPTQAGGSAAFTLIELMIVLAIIGLIMLSVLPSITQLFSAGADAQAFNMLTAQLTAARARAIKSGKYTAVHVQLADQVAAGFEKLDGKCFMAIMEWDPTIGASGAFTLADGFTPREVPGGFAFGEIRDIFVASGDFDNTLDWSDGSADLEDFTTFSVVFSPSGSAVKSIGSQLVQFADSTTPTPLFDKNNQGIWSDVVANKSAAGEAAATAVTMFNHGEFTDVAPADRATYLNSNAQFIPINVYTGQLFARL